MRAGVSVALAAFLVAGRRFPPRLDGRPHGGATNKSPVYKPLPVGAVTKPWHLCVAFPHMKDAYYVAKDYGIMVEAKRQGVSATIMAASGYERSPNRFSRSRIAWRRRQCRAGECRVEDRLERPDRGAGQEEDPVLDLGNGVTSDLIAAAALAQYYYAGATAGNISRRNFLPVRARRR